MALVTARRQNKNQADYMTAAYQLMLPVLKIVRDVYGGTLAIRKARVEYLPKNPQEPDDEYKARLDRSVFLPAFKRVITLALGLIFHKDPSPKDLDPEIEKHLDNIDLAGTSMAVFLREVTRAALRDGHCFLYVDMPPAVEQSDSLAPAPTLADENEANIRPYWVLYQKHQAVNWSTATVNGRLVLDQITFMECSYEKDGDFGEKEVTRFRVLNPGRVRVYKQVKKNQLELESDKPTPLDEIPVFPVYGGEEEEPFVSTPPLLDLAWLNIQHYQMTSDLHNILHVANVPILWARDRNTSVPFQAVGPSILIDLKGEHSEIGYAEHEGKAIGKAQEEIDRTERRMSVAGFELMAEQTNGPKTATGEIIDSAESDSALSLAVKSLQSALQSALEAHAEYMGLKPKGSLTLNVEYDRLVLSTEEMRVLKEFAEDHFLSNETLLELMKRAGKLGPDFDVKAELDRIYGADSSLTDVERAAKEDLTRQQNANQDPAGTPPGGPAGGGKPTTKTKPAPTPAPVKK